MEVKAGRQAGHAVLTVPGPSDGYLEIYDERRERWLGAADWQPQRLRIGPFERRELENGSTEVSLPPAVCNLVESFSILSVTTEGRTGRVRWPENVGTASTEPGTDDGIHVEPPVNIPTTPEPEAVASPPDPPEAPADAPVASVDESDDGRGRFPLLAGGAIAAVLVVGLAVWLLMSGGNIFVDPCSARALTEPGETEYDARFTQYRECGGEVEEGTALRVLEEGARLEHGYALFSFARLYDPSVTASEIVQLPKNVSIAVEYYARAQMAGVAEAAVPLAVACDALDRADPVQDRVHRNYCN